MKKKIFLSIFFMLILLTNVSLASYSTVTMSIVEEPVCTISLGSNSKFEKKLISKDLKNKEVTLQLQVTNNESVIKPTGELMLVLDNSNSMTEEVSNGKTRKNLIFESANSLINNLLKDNEQLKIGIVSFSTNTDISKEGTIDDASIISSLSNKPELLQKAISNIKTDGPRTNLQSGLRLASQQFTKESTNKYIIVLTDGVPNVAIDYDKHYYSDDVISKTKKELQSLGDKNISVITMLTGISDESYVPVGVTKTFKQIISEVFGTATSPTVGKFYYVTDDKIEQTITTDIYNSLVPIKNAYKDITIVDYFPDEIIKNFDFAYVSKATKGNISAKVDEKNNSITWTIPELSNGETATVQYKLKLKENFDSKIVDKVLNTNKKVDITYKDFDEKEQKKTSDISPKIKLTEPPVTPKQDPTEAPKEMPKAGKITTFSACVIILGVATFSFVKYTDLKNKTKY